MVSINATTTNRAVLTILRQTNDDIALNQKRIASGLKVASASDNVTVWNTAQGLRKDIAATETISGNLVLAKGQVDAANQALTSIADIITKMQTAANGLTAYVSGTANSNADIQKQIASYQGQILGIVNSATLQGVNLLTEAGVTAHAFSPTIAQDNNTSQTMTFTSQVILSADGTTSGTLLAQTSSSAYGQVIGSTAFDGSSSDSATVIGYFKTALATGLAAVNSYASRLANFSSALGAQQDFLTKINDIRSSAVSSMVDANMEEESAKSQALQVKQQLAYQALAIGNSSAQNILRLFQ